MSPTITATMHRAVWRSPAKVNLCLRITGRRDDGYHLLDSIFVPIDLCDRIVLDIDGLRAGVETSLEVRCDVPGVPQDGRNLAARAARALLAECGYGARVRLRIEKTIPPGAGLGGGSGNAATVLRGLSALLGLAVPAARLRDIALHLGADVPFFLCGGTARVRGIGEDVQPIGGWPGLRLVVAVPPVEIATAWAFRVFAERADGGRWAVGDEPARLAAGAKPAADLLVNDLERVVLPAFPVVAEVKARLLEAGASAVVMSGSGAAVVGVAPSAAAAERIAAMLRRALPEVRAHAVGVFREPPVDPGRAPA